MIDPYYIIVPAIFGIIGVCAIKYLFDRKHP